jgi:hypothetical protein
MTSIGLTLVILLGILLLVLPRQVASVPLVIGTCYLTLGQSFDIFGLNFYAFRVLIIIGWLRIILRREIALIELNAIDKLIILWIVSSVVTYTLLYQTWEAFVYRLGLSYNCLGLYFLFRALIRNLNEFRKLLKITSVIIIPVAALMLREHLTGFNVFSIFGGVQEISEIRKGQFRAQGPFRSPILAGTFGATFLPLIVPLWWQDRGRRFALMGAIASIAIVFSSKSSGPTMACLSGVIGLLMWRFRQNMKVVRWWILLVLLSLHFIVMKAPVWYLFDRVSEVLGGSGWYRAELIEQSLVHFEDWWLMGTKDTSSWMAFVLFEGKADITNQFIGEGVNGGLLTLSLFVLIIVFCFKAVGGTIQKLESEPFATRLFAWAMGSSLFAHVLSFFSVAYFDQTIVVWFLLLASISSVNSSLNGYEINGKIIVRVDSQEHGIRSTTVSEGGLTGSGQSPVNRSIGGEVKYE